MNKRKKKQEKPIIYPMMPRKYSSAQREKLRQFEKELLKGRKVTLY